MNENHNSQAAHPHSHMQPLQTVTLTFDPNHNQLTWLFENIDAARAIQQIELAKLFIFNELLAAQTKPEATQP